MDTVKKLRQYHEILKKKVYEATASMYNTAGNHDIISIFYEVGEHVSTFSFHNPINIIQYRDNVITNYLTKLNAYTDFLRYDLEFTKNKLAEIFVDVDKSIELADEKTFIHKVIRDNLNFYKILGDYIEHGGDNRRYLDYLKNTITTKKTIFSVNNLFLVNNLLYVQINSTEAVTLGEFISDIKFIVIGDMRAYVSKQIDNVVSDAVSLKTSTLTDSELERE